MVNEVPSKQQGSPLTIKKYPTFFLNRDNA